MTSTYVRPVLLVFGIGPGLGMSVAKRFGREGFRIAIVSRNADRHAEYLASLADAQIEAQAFTANADNADQVRGVVNAVRAQFGRLDVGYFGPASPGSNPISITEMDERDVDEALKLVLPAVRFGSILLPELARDGRAGLLFTGGLSSVVPVPSLGPVTLAMAALRNYALTLNAALEPEGVFVGHLAIGGLIERGDIFQAAQANPALFGELNDFTLNPDDLADILWKLYSDRSLSEATASAFGG